MAGVLFWILIPYQIRDLRIFPLILWVVFNAPDGVLLLQKVLTKFDEMQFIRVHLVSHALCVIAEKLVLTPASRRSSPRFSSKSFIVLPLKLRSLNHFELIFADSMRLGSNIILSHVDIGFPRTVC